MSVASLNLFNIYILDENDIFRDILIISWAKGNYPVISAADFWIKPCLVPLISVIRYIDIIEANLSNIYWVNIKVKGDQGPYQTDTSPLICRANDLQSKSMDWFLYDWTSAMTELR